MMPRKHTAKDLWMPKRRIEIKYKSALKKLMDKMYKHIKDCKTTAEIVRKLKKFAESKEFKEYAERASMQMVTALFSDAGKTWREAAKHNTQGKGIYEALKKEMQSPIGGYVREQVRNNADLIKSIPLDLARDVTEHVGKESMKGRRASSIAEDLQELVPSMSNRKATLIARTEVSKASTALTRARSENIGIKWYIWRTSEDQRVRSSHSHMEGVLINWDNPPSPEKLIGMRHIGYYHAGNIFNCRCYPEPVVSLNFVKWPCKVYHGGKITSMTRKQFEGIALVA